VGRKRFTEPRTSIRTPGIRKLPLASQNKQRTVVKRRDEAPKREKIRIKKIKGRRGGLSKLIRVDKEKNRNDIKLRQEEIDDESPTIERETCNFVQR